MCKVIEASRCRDRAKGCERCSYDGRCRREHVHVAACSVAHSHRCWQLSRRLRAAYSLPGRGCHRSRCRRFRCSRFRCSRIRHRRCLPPGSPEIGLPAPRTNERGSASGAQSTRTNSAERAKGLIKFVPRLAQQIKYARHGSK